MLISITIAAMMLALWRFPDALASRIITSRLIQPLASRLMKIERRHVLFVLLFIAVIAFAGELLAIGGPLDAGLIVLWDVSTYVDILMVASVAGLSARAVAALRIASARMRRMRSTQGPMTRRHVRHRKAARQKPSANDDDHAAIQRAAA